MMDGSELQASPEAVVVSTDVYLFADSRRLPEPTLWRTKLRELDERWDVRLDSFAMGRRGVAILADAEIRLSIRDSTAELERLGIQRRVGDLDTCIRFDCWPEVAGAIAMVQAISTLAVLAAGLTFNPLPEETFVEPADAMSWCERCLAALNATSTGSPWPGSYRMPGWLF